MQGWVVPGRRERREIRRGDGGVKRTIAHSFVITLRFGSRSGRRHCQARVGRITTGQRRHNGHTAAKYGCHSSTDLLILFCTYKVVLFTGAATALCKQFHLKFRLCIEPNYDSLLAIVSTTIQLIRYNPQRACCLEAAA